MTDQSFQAVPAPRVQDVLPAPPSVGPGSPPLTDGTVKPDIVAVSSALVRACGNCAYAAMAGADARDAKDFGQAALYFAQAVVTLDPSRVAPGGGPVAPQFPTPPDTSQVDPNAPKKPGPISPKTPVVTDRNHNGVIGG